MKKTFFIFLIFWEVCFFTGCATKNLAGTEDYEEIETSISDMDGNVIVKRDSGFMGSALSSNIYIDNKFIVKLKPGKFIKIKLEDGVHFISISSGKEVNLGTAFERNLRIEIKDDTVRTFRVFPMPGQGMMIEETMH